MASSTSSIAFLSFFFLISSAQCFNISRILGTYPDYSIFNQYLTQTHLAEEINRRQTITVLTVSNDQMQNISGQPLNVIKNILSLHVVLDFYDEDKLHALSKKTALLTTLFQSSGVAENQEGFLNVTNTQGEIAFGSAEKGSPLTSMLVKAVVAQRYNISVLEITKPVVPSGLVNAKTNTTHSPPPAPAQSPPPAKAPSPSKAKAPAAATPAEVPAPSDDTTAPSDAPTADAPAPTADGLAAADAPGPSADVVADAPTTKISSGTRVGLEMFVAFVIVGLSSLVLL